MTTTATSARMRGVVVAVSSLLVTAAAHDLGGASAPSQSAAVALLAVCAGVGWVASSTRLGTGRLLAALVAAQVLGHLTLVAVDGHLHGPMLDPAMAAAHAVAVGVCVVAVCGAERGLTRAARAMCRILPAVPAVIAVDTDTVRPPLPVVRRGSPGRLPDLSGRGTRGPPARFR